MILHKFINLIKCRITRMRHYKCLRIMKTIGTFKYNDYITRNTALSLHVDGPEYEY